MTGTHPSPDSGNVPLPPLNLDGAAHRTVTNSAHHPQSSTVRPRHIPAAVICLILTGLAWLATPIVLWIFMRQMVRRVVDSSTEAARSTLIEWVHTIAPDLIPRAVTELGDTQLSKAIATLIFDQFAGAALSLFVLAVLFLIGYIATAVALLKRSNGGRITTIVLILVAYVPIIAGGVALAALRLGLSLANGFTGFFSGWITNLLTSWPEAPAVLTDAVVNIFTGQHAEIITTTMGNMLVAWEVLFLTILVLQTIVLVILFKSKVRLWFAAESGAA